MFTFERNSTISYWHQKWVSLFLIGEINPTICYWHIFIYDITYTLFIFLIDIGNVFHHFWLIMTWWRWWWSYATLLSNNRLLDSAEATPTNQSLQCKETPAQTTAPSLPTFSPINQWSCNSLPRIRMTAWKSVHFIKSTLLSCSSHLADRKATRHSFALPSHFRHHPTPFSLASGSQLAPLSTPALKHLFISV